MSSSSASMRSKQGLHAEQERLRADTLAAEVERLKALLAQGGVNPAAVRRNKPMTIGQCCIPSGGVNPP